MKWLRHALFLGIALAITVIGFQFWGKFAGAMKNVSHITAVAPAKPSGEVTMSIVLQKAPAKPCPKDHPCPP